MDRLRGLGLRTAWLIALGITSTAVMAGDSDPIRSRTSWATSVSEAQVQQGAARFAAGDLEGAIQALRRACELTPDSARVHFMLGNAYARHDEFLSAAEAYRTAFRLRPDHPDTPLNLGFTLYRGGRIDEACDAWREAVRQVRFDPLSRVALAVGELTTGDREMAMFHFSVAVYLDSTCATSAYYEQDFRWGESGRRAAAQLVELMRQEAWE